MLKSKAVGSGYINFDHDCWRYLMQGKGKACEHKGHYLYELKDFERFSIVPCHWWYFLNEHGEGRKVSFPMKVKAVVMWSPKKHILNCRKLVEAPRFPLEKLTVTFARLPCNEENIFKL